MEQILGTPLIPQVDYTSTSYGSVLLKSLQTEKLPELDLLVREAVQNSSDASLSIENEQAVWIDFSYGSFDSYSLCEQLGSVGEAIALHRQDILDCKGCLEIRDRKTVGLTGPYRKEELDASDHGNYFKLIFDSGINQTQSGAGGNWGFGKSVYYRIGRAGIVAYYSQISSCQPNGDKEERLVVTMVEDESSPKSVLAKIVSGPSGRAWWGRPFDEDGVVLPITDHDHIEKFLGLFGLKPFHDNETGTSIIVPFVDEDKVLGDIIPHNALPADIEARCVWKDSVPKYLEHALQKWYAPRLGNNNLKLTKTASKKIRATVITLKEGDPEKRTLSYPKMDSFFQLVQDLYTTALFEVEGLPAPERRFDSSIKAQAIKVHREGLSTSTVGYVSYARVTSGEIYGLQAGLSPYIMTGNFNNSEDENEPIVLSAREPGMVISYSIDGTWSKGVKAPVNNAGSSQDEYIIAFFVPAVENAFKEDSGNRAIEYVNLGGYLRKCEDSDHANWEDKAKFKLISKIKLHVGKKIAVGTKNTETISVNASASRLSGRLGKALMPSRGLLAAARKNGSAGGGGSGGGSTGGAKPFFKTTDPVWKNGSLTFPFELGMGEKLQRVIQIEVQTEGGTLSPKAWNEQIGSSFPAGFRWASASVEKLNGELDLVSCDANCIEEESGALYGALVPTGDNATGFEVRCTVPGQLIVGELALFASDRTIEFILKAL